MVNKDLTSIIYHFTFDESSKSWNECKSINSANQLNWIHLDASNESSARDIQHIIPDIDQPILDSLIQKETRPNIEQFGDIIIINMRGINLNKNASPEDMVSVRMLITGNTILTAQLRPLKLTQDIAKQINTVASAGDFISLFMSKVILRMESFISELHDEADEIEQHLLDQHITNESDRLLILRKKLVLLHRYLAPQYGIINETRDIDELRLSEDNHARLALTANTTKRYVEEIDTLKERAQIINEELNHEHAARMDKNTYVLSIIAGIFLPLGFLTGLLGMNVAGIPGTQHPYGFIIVCTIFVVLVVLQYVLFKRMQWF